MRRTVAGPDERVPLDLTYTQIGMIMGALSVLQLGCNGRAAELVQREIEALRAEINEQVQETAQVQP